MCVAVQSCMCVYDNVPFKTHLVITSHPGDCAVSMILNMVCDRDEH